MGALTFGHLPTIFVPGGPMTSGVPNKEKARDRQLFAEGKVGRDALLESEAQSYHSQGTCTFYGTANSNQVLMEVMGLHLPGAAFVHAEHAAARCAHQRGCAARSAHHGAGWRVSAARPDRRRTRNRERHRGIARHGRLDQSHAAPCRNGARRGRPDQLG